MSDIATVDRRNPPAISPSTDPVSMMATLALDERIDENKLRVLWDIQKDMLAERRKEQAEAARVAYSEALAKAQEEFPIVERDAVNSHTRSRYAKIEKIWEECRPIWTKHGFSVSFPSGTTPEGNIRMTLCIRHSSGHVEHITAPDAPPDGVGSQGKANKTIVQANQSTVSYLKRGLICSGFGIVTREEDDDGSRPQSEPQARRDDRSLTEMARAGEFNRKQASSPPVESSAPNNVPPRSAWLQEVDNELTYAKDFWAAKDHFLRRVRGVGSANYLTALLGLEVVKKIRDSAPPKQKKEIEEAIKERASFLADVEAAEVAEKRMAAI